MELSPNPIGFGTAMEEPHTALFYPINRQYTVFLKISQEFPVCPALNDRGSTGPLL
jgi:hypothetical protein